MEKYGVLAFIGEGSFGRVFKVKNKETNGIYALKVIRKKGRSLKDLRNLRQECDIQQYLRHPNIIRMIESFDTDSELVVVTEFAEKELHSTLGKEGCLQEAKAQVLTWDLVSALYYLHSHRVLHRDLKPQNVLIDANGRAKLCDFGLARNMTTGTHVLTSIKGTPLYMAPELIDEKPYDHQADLWSLGCIVYEMMAGQPPFYTSSIVQLVRLIRHRPVQWPSFISPQAISFLQGLLHKDPSLRLTWPEILVQPFVAGHILILQEQSTIDSPFTIPLTQSQMVAKQLQKQRLNSAQKFMPQAVKILERREKMMGAAINTPAIAEGALVSDDDSIRAVSAVSIRDSFRTDDEEIQTITEVHADLLTHEFKVLNQDNLIISNLDTNMAELALQPRAALPVVKENQESNIVANKTSQENQLVKKDSTGINNQLNRRKLSQNLDNFSIRLRSNSKTNKKENADKNPEENKDSSKNSKPSKETVLSKSVPPSYKQKILQFSKEKFGFGSGNKLTRSLKKSWNLNKTGDKDKIKGRRMSEPVALNTLQTSVTDDKLNASQDAQEKCDNDVPEITENIKLDDANSDAQNFFDDDCNPIEQEEWLAFMRSNMNEVMEGDVESLMQQNIVSMIVSVARHSGAGAEVRGSLAALLSLPMVASDVSCHTINSILKVYQDVKLVPNLVYASRLLVRQSATESGNDKISNLVRKLSNEEMIALSRLIELTTQLCLRGVIFVQQLCDAVAILNTATLMAQFLSIHDISLRITLNTVTMMTVILQDLPENAELVESVLFEDGGVDICKLLDHPSDTLKIRMCILIDLLGRYCCSALCKSLSSVWGTKQREALESLQTHSNQTLNKAAKCAVRDLSKLPFYKQTEGKT